MNALTNNSGLSLAMAVWLAHDEYDASSGLDIEGKNVISATSLMKPTRALILAGRVPPDEASLDVSDLVASRIGQAYHESVEHAWTHGYRQAMKRLGYPRKLIERVRINPADDELFDDIIPVYLEQRYAREIDMEDWSVVITGKFDQIINGELNDTKSTSVYSYIHNSRTEDYKVQGSIYRWINPTKVTSEVLKIQLIFTDWQKSQSRTSSTYPKNRMIEFPVELMPEHETETWIRKRIGEIAANQDLPEHQIVRCTDEELWKSDPQFKYYADPRKAAEGTRSTKNFANYPAAEAHRNALGKGVIVTIPGQVKRCSYCPAFTLCSQQEEYANDHDRA